MYSMLVSRAQITQLSDESPDSLPHLRPQNAAPALEPFYYVKNFELVLETVLSRYSDLLLEDELQFANEFPRLPLSSRALLARMVMRSGDLFRLSKLNYAEIGETRSAAVPLVEAGWVSDRPHLRIDELFGILTKSELIRSLRLPSRYASWRKADLQAMLASQFTEPRYIEEWHGGGDLVYALKIGPLCDRFRVLFFGNHRQRWTEFVTADLKIFNYEKIDYSLQSRPFQTRAQFEVFQRLQECREMFERGMPLDELNSMTPDTIEDVEWLEERRQRLLFRIAREYERAGENPKALAMYLHCRHRGARVRAIRLKARAQDWEGARTLCVLAMENPESEAELQAVQRILPRAMSKLKIAYEPKVASAEIEEFDIVFKGPPRAGMVEHHVRDHLARGLADSTTVRFVENGLIPSLFGLLCWPAVFAPVPGAFFHDYHHGPVDLGSADFYRRRRQEFEDCFSELESGRYAQVIWQVFKQKWGILSPFVRWSQLDKTLLQWALNCFPAAHLRVWFEWIIRDVKENRAGFPDLVQFWPQERRYRMIEVKGPGDKLQDNQRRFLELCVARNMPVSVCYAKWNG
jgi:hypothetical protein